jgi:hypothetical protein
MHNESCASSPPKRGPEPGKGEIVKQRHRGRQLPLGFRSKRLALPGEVEQEITRLLRQLLQEVIRSEGAREGERDER